MKDKIYESIADLLNARSVITLLVFGSACYLCVKQKPVPELLQQGCYGLFTVWFGEKFWGFISAMKGGAAK